MVAQNREKIKANIRDMLRKARDPAAFEGEIANALRFADRLMRTYHITEEEALASDPHERQAQVDRKKLQTVYSEHGRLTAWESILANFVGKLIGSVGHYTSERTTVRMDGVIRFRDDGRPKIAIPITWYGSVEDVEIAADLFSETATIIAAMARLKFGGVCSGPGRDYAIGFVDSLWKKLDQGRAEDAKLSQASNALIVRSTELAAAKREDAKQWLKKTQGIELVSGKGGPATPWDSWSDAYQDGARDGKAHNVDVTRKKKLA